MLYVSHAPLGTASLGTASPNDVPVVRRMLLTSANMSAAPWGYAAADGASFEVRSFELGVSVAPADPEALVAPFADAGTGYATAPRRRQEAIPFHMEAPRPCRSPYVGFATWEGDKGCMNY